MKLTHTKLLKENKQAILENVRQAKQYEAQGKLTSEELKTLIDIDPTPTRKFVGWMAKQWINKTVTDIDDLRNTVEEFNVFLNKGKTRTKDINQFKTFKDLSISEKSELTQYSGIPDRELYDKSLEYFEKL